MINDKIQARPHIVAQVLPLLQTTWGQGGEYAQMVTNLGWTNGDIGCQCLALAQILHYHRLQPHHSDTGFYTCSREGEFDRIVNLTFGENYFFPLFPYNFDSSAVTDFQKLLVQSYLFDVAKAFRKDFYGGYGPNRIQERVELLTTHFDIEAEYHPYEVGRDMPGAKQLIRSELSNNRPLWMRGDRTGATLDQHAVVVDGFREKSDGGFYISVKWGNPSDHNSDPNNPDDPPWFKLEDDIGSIDGNERRFIRIKPKRYTA